MTTKSDILKILKNHKSDFSKFGVNHIGLFGSYSRGEQTKSSDIDLLVDFEPSMENYDNFMGLCDLVEQLFQGEEVEVITQNGLSKYIGPYILKEVIYA
jgi:predicted nucleotidyltransferase